MSSQEVEALFLISALSIGIIGTIMICWKSNKKPIELFDEITNLVEYVGGPLDGQRSHPWEQGEYLFRRSQDPERAADGIGALYKRVPGSSSPVRYEFCGYGRKHLIEDCQEV